MFISLSELMMKQYYDTLCKLLYLHNILDLDKLDTTNKLYKMALELTDSNFEQEVLKSDVPVLVDFWAVWCGPCKMIAPIIEELSAEYDGKVKIGKMNVDENRMTPGQFGIRSIPTLLVFKGGEVVDKLVGAVPKNNIADKLDAQLA
jgi:thioredoxin 1